MQNTALITPISLSLHVILRPLLTCETKVSINNPYDKNGKLWIMLKINNLSQGQIKSNARWFPEFPSPPSQEDQTEWDSKFF